MEKKSLSKNAFLNGFRNVLNLLFPLVTFPYVSRILSIEGIGQYNFAQALISYFSLIAGVGISSYAIREGAKHRNDKIRFNIFSSEILLCNIISTLIAYIALGFCMYWIEKFKAYTVLILVFSIQIGFTTIGVEWLYCIYEEYEYITIRGIVFKLISIVLIFILVKDKEDVAVYAAITVFSSVGSNVLNLMHSRRYFHIAKISLKDCIKHVKPILIVFASNIAIMIYVYSDTTMLGFLQTDYEIGIYSVSVKIYNIVKNLLSSVLIVSIPRLSMYYGKGMKADFEKTVQKVYDSITALILPAVIGLFFISRQVILVISDSSYIPAQSSLRILCMALVFCIYGWFFSQCVLMPAKKENVILIATCISATVNIGLNFILIPLWKENAAAFTTLIAELIMFIICGWFGLKNTKIELWNRNMFSVVAGCAAVVCVCIVIPMFINMGVLMQLLIMIVLSGFAYGLILLLLHNSIVYDMIKKVIKIR